jgi:uncharacterized protein YdcH (DUF465 family)
MRYLVELKIIVEATRFEIDKKIHEMVENAEDYKVNEIYELKKNEEVYLD